LDPDQTQLFYPTLRQGVLADHPVHLVREVLDQYDWGPWEGMYVLVEGQPPIHPRYVAGALVYGMSLGIRSSRKLEEACRSRLDVMLLTNGHAPDHTTFAKFRTRFREPLRDLFRFLGELALRMGLARLNGLALDGTRVRANSSRHATATAATLEARLAELDRQVAAMLAEAEARDREDDTLFGPEETPYRLSRGLADVRRRQEALARALAKAREQEARRAKAAAEPKAAEGGEAAAPAPAPPPRAPKVPVADPDATIQPNKEGGFAPNYTPMAGVETHGGFILDTDVLPDSDEGRATLPTLDRIGAVHGSLPGELLADSKHGSGANLAGLADRGVAALIPLEGRHDRPDNPAHRPDPTQPVPEAQWPRLPRSPVTKKLDRAAFVYDPGQDLYRCPMGRPLLFHHEHTKRERNSRVRNRVYHSEPCGGCPLAGECLAGQAGHRSVCRDEHEGLREAMDARRRTPEGRATYARRSWASETVFGVLKTVMHLRQFLLRGLDKVKTEWLWACTAYNLGKLVHALARPRGPAWTGAS
jgi:transposase